MVSEYIAMFSTKRDAVTAAGLLATGLREAGLEERAVEYDALVAELEKYDDSDLAERVMEYFNEVCGTSFRQTIKVRTIIRQIPKATFEQFQSIILHRYELWGNDPKMKEFLRPATLFGSKQRFLQYLDEATNYWVQKQKHEAGRTERQVEQVGQ